MEKERMDVDNINIYLKRKLSCISKKK